MDAWHAKLPPIQVLRSRQEVDASNLSKRPQSGLGRRDFQRSRCSGHRGRSSPTILRRRCTSSRTRCNCKLFNKNHMEITEKSSRRIFWICWTYLKFKLLPSQDQRPQEANRLVGGGRSKRGRRRTGSKSWRRRWGRRRRRRRRRKKKKS
ncbi:unnamed protein product [Nesidiocoris tenuis]|uniref:Uncharacterized protein n=1 Tax=Nesidiocoris tenuis TaxID=355587 RepID=A0A6H5H040_9HEMI|nr:unnamed protein product [Nesidiocoris tenuis]